MGRDKQESESFFHIPPLWKPLANFIPLASLLGIKGVYHYTLLEVQPFLWAVSEMITSTVLIKISTRLSPVGSVQDQASSEGGGHTMGPAREGHLGSACVRLGMNQTPKAFQNGRGVNFCMTVLSRNQNIIFLVFFYLLPSAWRGVQLAALLALWSPKADTAPMVESCTGTQVSRVASRPRNWRGRPWTCKPRIALEQYIHRRLCFLTNTSLVQTLVMKDKTRM